MTKIPVGTHTFFEDFDLCQKRAWHKFVAKDLPRETPGAALVWGRRVHEAFEMRLKYKTPLPKDMEVYESLLSVIDGWGSVQEPGTWFLLEEELAIDQNGNSCNYFGENVWFRGKLDVAIIRARRAVMLDYKTGKKWKEDPTELRRHALLLKCAHPDVEHITGHYLWLQEPANQRLGVCHDLNNHAATFATLQHTRDGMDVLMKINEQWPPRPNPLCNYCPVRTCEFHDKWGK